MKHKEKFMKKTTSGSEEVWYVDSGASNYITSHEEWFSYLEKLEHSGVVETGDNSPDLIVYVKEVSLSHVR